MHLQTWSCRTLLSAGLLLLSTSVTWGAPPNNGFFKCDDPTGILCAEERENPGGKEYYVGHDEPSVLFYSDTPGAGFNNVYRLRLPKDPALLPKKNGSGGTWNFQLHPAFWFGMAMCDDQGNPNPGGSHDFANIPCTADSDSNIFDSPDPSAPDYIGRHPGTAFMEMQFYPPGWINSNSGAVDAESATKWTAALNIDSFQSNDNVVCGTEGPNCLGGVPPGPRAIQANNAACSKITNDEYVNFAFIQTDGKPFPAGSPSPLGPLVSTNAKTLRMNGGDELIVTIADTGSGLKVVVRDLTTGQSGFMVASGANGFASVKWDPSGNNCDFATHNLAHDFHPAYATSSEHTRVPGAAHSYNIAFSDEIGHFEYCNGVAKEGGACTSASGSDKKAGVDDGAFGGCFDAGFAASLGLIQIGGCLDSDTDFDGVPYRNNTWPGAFTDPVQDALFHAQPVIFSSPLLTDSGGHLRNFARVAFETDMPRIEFATNPPCQRHLSNPADPNPGLGCVNPPVGADFYPFYSTRSDDGACLWQEGGPFIPGTVNNLGGSSQAEFGSIPLALFYPAVNIMPQFIYEDFRNILTTNPCPASTG
jgi:hypothetical protein